LCHDVLSLYRRGPDDIGQLADVACRLPGHDERVEVRISLDALDPPAGRVRVIPGRHDGGEGQVDDAVADPGAEAVAATVTAAPSAAGSRRRPADSGASWTAQAPTWKPSRPNMLAANR
jgi:hypothetical protein